MVANNLLEIYTLMFAWNMYEAIWNLLTGTGLAFIPFIVAIFTSFKEGYSDSSGGAKAAIASLEVSAIGMIVVLMLCVIPLTNSKIKLSAVKYTFSVRDCHPDTTTKKIGSGNNTGTGYDGAFSDLGGNLEINKPLMWSLVETLSAAFTHSTIQSMTCANNYEYMLLQVAGIKFTNAAEERIKDFKAMCYDKAKSEYETRPLLSSDIEQNRASYSRVQDIDWIGSHILLNGYHTNFYRAPDAYMSNMEKHGFSRRTTLRDTDKGTESGAHPSCREVWSGEGVGLNGTTWFGADGLREVLLKDIKSSGGQKIIDRWLLWGSDVITKNSIPDSEKEDLLLKMVLKSDEQNLSSKMKVDLSNDFDIDQGKASKAFEAITGWIGTYENINEFIKANAVKHMMKIIGPMVLALLQLVIIMSAPFIMFFGMYKASTFLQLGIAYFALEFVNAIWAVCYWFDQRIMDIYLSRYEWYDNPGANLLINTVSAATILLLPMIWLSVISIAGSGMLRGMTGSVSGSAPGAAAGYKFNSKAMGSRFLNKTKGKSK